MPRVKVLKPFANDRITGVYRDRKETEVENGMVRVNDEFDADPIYTRQAVALGNVEIVGGGEVTNEDIEAQELVPHHSVSQTDIDRAAARRAGRRDPIASAVASGSAGMAPAGAPVGSGGQPRPSVAPTTAARATAPARPAGA